MTNIGCFSEMHLFDDCGSVRDYIVDNVDYDVEKMVEYLNSFKHTASCPRSAVDCLTGEEISPSFFVYEDGEFRWCDFLIYHVKKYKIRLPQELIDKANARKTA